MTAIQAPHLNPHQNVQFKKKQKVFAFIFPFLIRTKLSENRGKMVRFLEIFQYHLRRIIINDTPRDGIKTFRWIRTH